MVYDRGNSMKMKSISQLRSREREMKEAAEKEKRGGFRGEKQIAEDRIKHERQRERSRHSEREKKELQTRRRS